jgi:hypothetical protein
VGTLGGKAGLRAVIGVGGAWRLYRRG